jgi:hypothetical protein
MFVRASTLEGRDDVIHGCWEKAFPPSCYTHYFHNRLTEHHDSRMCICKPQLLARVRTSFQKIAFSGSVYSGLSTEQMLAVELVA